MTDDLRAKIAAALCANFPSTLIDHSDALEVADVVIAELDAMGIIHLSRVVGCQTGPVGHEGECR